MSHTYLIKHIIVKMLSIFCVSIVCGFIAYHSTPHHTLLIRYGTPLHPTWSHHPKRLIKKVHEYRTVQNNRGEEGEGIICKHHGKRVIDVIFTEKVCWFHLSLRLEFLLPSSLLSISLMIRCLSLTLMSGTRGRNWK